jgi:hypothetical protein
MSAISTWRVKLVTVGGFASRRRSFGQPPNRRLELQVELVQSLFDARHVIRTTKY